MIDRTLILDAWSKRQQTPIVLLVQGESEGRQLTMQLMDHGTPADLRGASVNFYYETPAPDSKEIFLPMTLEDGENGMVSVVMTSAAVATAGTVEKTWVRVSLPSGGNFQVLGPVLFIAQGADTEAIEASNDFSALDEALADTQRFIQRYEALTDISYYTAGMTTEAFLTAMPAYTTVIVPGTTAANLADAPAQTCIYQLSKGAGTDNMSGKCYGAGDTGEYFYTPALGWVKNAKTGDLSAYVPMAGVSYTNPMTGPIFIDQNGQDNVCRLGIYQGAEYDFVSLAICPRGQNTQLNQLLIYPDGTAKVGNTGVIITTDKVHKTLWTGSWSSGNISVPGFSDYSLFEITYDNKGSKTLAMKHGTYFRGIGGFPASASTFMILGFGATFSGNTLTFGYAAERNIIAGTQTELTVTSIIGIV